MDRLIKALAAFPVSDLQSEHLSREELYFASSSDNGEKGESR